MRSDKHLRIVIEAQRLSEVLEMMQRREMVKAAVAAGGASLLCHQTALPEDNPPQIRIIDTNVSLFQWPFRRLPLDETQALVTRLRALGITEAWAGSFEGVLHRDIAGVNQRLASTCRQHPELVPIGSVNLELPGWEEDFRRCIHEHNMPGIRLHPNYHGYTLKDPRFRELLQRSSSAGRFVQIATTMEDTRTQHPMLSVPDVDLSALPDQVRGLDDVRVQILNSRPRGSMLENLAKSSAVYFDVSRVDATDGVAKLLQMVPSERVMFGTHAPFLIPEAALIRIHESDLSARDQQLLLRASASKLRGAGV